MNECQLNENICPELSDCHNTDGSYECHCIIGYELSDNECIDINECETNSGFCPKNSKCINNIGSYDCKCDSGYHMKKKNVKNLRQCEDVNECLLLQV